MARTRGLINHGKFSDRSILKVPSLILHVTFRITRFSSSTWFPLCPSSSPRRQSLRQYRRFLPGRSPFFGRSIRVTRIDNPLPPHPSRRPAPPGSTKLPWLRHRTNSFSSSPFAGTDIYGVVFFTGFDTDGCINTMYPTFFANVVVENSRTI